MYLVTCDNIRLSKLTNGDRWPNDAQDEFVTTKLTRTEKPGALSTSFARLLKGVEEDRRGSRARSTLRAYKKAWERFAAWCKVEGRVALPAESVTVSAYMRHLSDTAHKVSTIEFALSAISVIHTKAKCPSPRADPDVREVRKGMRRRLGVAPRRVQALMADTLREIVNGCNGVNPLRDLRDVAILTLGFVGAFRRSELVGLDVSDCRVDSSGVSITLRRSKTDQEGGGVVVSLPRGDDPALCPAQALARWLNAANIKDGPVFRRILRAECKSRIGNEGLSAAAVAMIVKRRVSAVGLLSSDYSAHSLRAGFITSAIKSGRQRDLVKKHSRHRNNEVFDTYVRPATQWDENAAKGVLS